MSTTAPAESDQQMPATSVSTLEMSHFEIRVRDVTPMLAFYVDVLAFVITDRGPGPGGLVFLSRSRDEHHQVVLNPTADDTGDATRVDHVAFRVATLSGLRAFQSRLAASKTAGVETVTHGTTWSLYFRDPERNRIEIFTDTPWYVEQPTRLPVDLDVDDARLHANSEMMLRPLPGFGPVESWAERHRQHMAQKSN